METNEPVNLREKIRQKKKEKGKIRNRNRVSKQDPRSRNSGFLINVPMTGERRAREYKINCDSW